MVLSVDMIQLSTKDNLKSTNSCSRQLNKLPAWWKTKILRIIKQQTIDIPKPNITLQSPKKKIAASSLKQLINKTLVLSFRFLLIQVFQATWFRILGQLMSKISISKMFWSKITVLRSNKVRLETAQIPKKILIWMIPSAATRTNLKNTTISSNCN